MFFSEIATNNMDNTNLGIKVDMYKSRIEILGYTKKIDLKHKNEDC